MTEYNGWTNKATWLVKLWIDNDQNEQDYWLDLAKSYATNPRAFSEELEGTYKDVATGILERAHLTPDQGMWSDLMTCLLDSVDWDSIAHHLIEDAVEMGA